MDWKPWLCRWSEEWIASASEEEPADPEVVRDRWLGFAPATPEDVAAAELRLGVRLPPSFRDFLLTTDGWRDAGIFVWRLRNSAELGWLREIEDYWEEWEDEEAHDNPADGNKFTRGLMISLEADAGILFLDPGDVDETGEWAAYSLFSWKAAPPERFTSFTALMEDLYAEFHRMRKPPGRTADAKNAQVAAGVAAALAGELDHAIELLEDADAFGADRACLPLAQLRLLLADHRASWSVEAAAKLDGFTTDPVFTHELLPALFTRHEQESRHRQTTTLQHMVSRNPDLARAVAHHEAKARRYSSGGLSDPAPAPQAAAALGGSGSAGSDAAAFGGSGLTGAVAAALAAHAARPDADVLWGAVLAAVPDWRPRTAEHVAPVALLGEAALAETLTPARGRALLSVPRGER